MKKLLLISWIIFLLLPSQILAQELVNEFPSDSQLFVQGFEINDKGQLIIGTGMYGDSQLGIMNYSTGEFDAKSRLNNDYFGEGITVTPSGIWQLTWKEEKAFLYDEETFDLIKEVSYQGEGWGLAYDPANEIIWMSNGSNHLTQRDPESFKLIDEIEVVDQSGMAVELLNELEFANGYLYANVWQSDVIVKINPNTGVIVKEYILTEIIDHAEISPQEKEKMDVLNGIAHLKNNHFLITGKYYPVIFEVILE